MVRAVVRERRLIFSILGVLLAVVLLLQFQTYMQGADLRATQKQRCMERNQDTRTLVIVLEEELRLSLERRAELDALIKSRDCSVY